MGEDQDPAGPRGLDEPERGDRLAGAGRVLEPEPPVGVGVLGLLVELDVLVELGRGPPSPGAPRPPPRPRPFSSSSSSSSPPRPESPTRPARPARARRPRRCRMRRRRSPLAPEPLAADAVALLLGEQRGQRSRQRIDLMRGQDRAVGEVRLVLGEQPLEPEQQREVAPPVDRGLLVAGLDLDQRGVERAAAGRARSKRVFEGLALVDELLACEQLRARDRGRIRKRGGITHGNQELRRLEERAAAVPRRGSGNLEQRADPTGRTSEAHGPPAGLLSEDHAIVLAHPDAGKLVGR